MSYDISLSINTGRRMTQIVDVGDPTYNLSEIFYRALGRDLTDLDGWRAQEVIELLQAAVKRMRDDMPSYKAMNPPNGWGTAEGALETLVKFAEACESHPLATVEIS